MACESHVFISRQFSVSLNYKLMLNCGLSWWYLLVFNIYVWVIFSIWSNLTKMSCCVIFVSKILHRLSIDGNYSNATIINQPVPWLHNRCKQPISTYWSTAGSINQSVRWNVVDVIRIFAEMHSWKRSPIVSLNFNRHIIISYR